MEQQQALKELADKVEAEKWPEKDFQIFHDIWSPLDWKNIAHHSRYAFNGSLDAAHSLHKAVLGDRWEWDVGIGGRFWVRNWDLPGPKRAICGGKSEQPARAWLLAIIKAKISELET